MSECLPSDVSEATPDCVLLGNPWGYELLLATNVTNPDGSQGDALDFSGSTFTPSSADLPDGVSFAIDVTGNTGPGSGGTVVVQLSAAQTALITTSEFVWYLAEDVVFNRKFMRQVVTFTGMDS